MTPKRLASLSLADALLATPAEPDPMKAAAIRVFGNKWRWIPGLCRHILRQTGNELHRHSRRQLAEIIESHTGYTRAWEGKERPHIAGYALDAPLLPPSPPWLPRHLPHLRSIPGLAQWLGLPQEELDWFSRSWRQGEREPAHFGHYFYRWEAKRHGGFRLIEIPKSRLREAQRRLLHGLVEHIPAHQAAHGFVRGRSCLSHASLHQGKAAVLRMDLRDFFSSIPASRIHALLTCIGFSEFVARTLAGLCTHATPWRELNTKENSARISFLQRQRLLSPHLPQGAPTSPALANLCAFRLDLRLDALANSVNAAYSRYADDLVFSGDKALLAQAERFHILVAAIALEEGFSLNMSKTRVMGAGQRQQTTGLVLNRHPNIPREDYDRLKAILHNCKTQGPTSQNREGLPDFRAHLLGRIAYVAAANPHKGERLKELFGGIRWEA